MVAAERRETLSAREQVHFCFSLGKAFEDRKDYERSFSYYEKGNGLKRAQSRYDSASMTQELREQAKTLRSCAFR